MHGTQTFHLAPMTFIDAKASGLATARTSLSKCSSYIYIYIYNVHSRRRGRSQFKSEIVAGHEITVMQEYELYEHGLRLQPGYWEFIEQRAIFTANYRPTTRKRSRGLEIEKIYERHRPTNQHLRYEKYSGQIELCNLSLVQVVEIFHSCIFPDRNSRNVVLFLSVCLSQQNARPISHYSKKVSGMWEWVCILLIKRYVEHFSSSKMSNIDLLFHLHANCQSNSNMKILEKCCDITTCIFQFYEHTRGK